MWIEMHNLDVFVMQFLEDGKIGKLYLLIVKEVNCSVVYSEFIMNIR